MRFDFVRFCMVGATGFLINFCLLTLTFKILGMPIFIAQLISGEISLFSNFLLHDRWTYKHKNVTKRLRHLLWQFHVTSWIAVAGSATLVSVCVHVFELNYVVSLIISSGTALFWNFTWTKYVIWRHDHEVPITEGNQ